MPSYISIHLAEIVVVQQSVFAALAAIAQLAGRPALSKWFGTFAAVDLGRILRALLALRSK